MKIGIVGLGLIGGSMAKSIKAHTDCTVWGFDINTETLNTAQLTGAIDETLSPDKFSECDIIMIAVPPAVTIEWVNENAPLLKGTVLIDLCGIKRLLHQPIAQKAAEYGFSYIGGHPMAGKEVSGFENASATLFEGASMILTPDSASIIDELEYIKHFYLQIGFDKVTFSNIEEHDRIISYTSQLAHITSSAYIKSPTAQRHFGFSAGSYKDMTRVAKLDEELWTELMLGNADFLKDELKLLIENLKNYLEALENNDSESLKELLKEGRMLKLTAGGD
ncbi:MAG: prephenate dehydrogenase/arogenate dehydrogenase family protein [Clostridia bacterium]|nr:prephenate dehydrogenase/arogenate dehydrogenase family protein [Clostridia bacterium]